MGNYSKIHLKLCKLTRGYSTSRVKLVFEAVLGFTKKVLTRKVSMRTVLIRLVLMRKVLMKEVAIRKVLMT